jgi:hypothetical protein
MDSERHKEKRSEGGWSPYLAGALTGLVIVLSVWLTGQYFGASTTFVRSAGMIEQAVVSERVAGMEYFVKYTPKVDWQFMFVAGILLGAFVSSSLSGTFRVRAVPDMWQQRFGPAVGKRAGVAFLGGAVAVFGARLAGG